MDYSKDYDAKKYISKPWHGQRGPPWTLAFKPDFEEALNLQRDNFSSVGQFLRGKDFGGWAPGAPPHIAGAGAAAIQNALSIAARISRGETFITLLKKHILNEDVKDSIDTQMAALLGAAPAAPPAGPGGPVVAGALPTDWAMQLWTWIHVNKGQLAQTGLLHSNQTDEWTAIKITDVGIDKNTPQRLYAHLERVNRMRQNPHPIIEVWTKYLKMITFPKLLADIALQQLQNPTYVIAGGPNAGQPDLPALVTVFEELWESIFNRGIEIKPQAPPRAQGPPSNRVDGMHAQSMSFQSFESDGVQWHGDLTEAQLHESFVLKSGDMAFAFLKDERNCWKCRGWGHTKEQCPSVARSRPLAGCITGLQELQANQNQRLRNMQSGRRVKRPGPSPGYSNRSNATNGNPQGSSSETVLIEYSDGGVFTAEGEMVTAPTMSTPESFTAEQVQGATPQVAQAPPPPPSAPSSPSAAARPWLAPPPSSWPLSRPLPRPVDAARLRSV